MTTEMYSACLKALRYVTDDFIYNQRDLRKELQEINNSLVRIADELQEIREGRTELPWDEEKR